MKITSVTIATLTLPLTRPFITAIRRTDAVHDVVVMVKTDSHHVGYGSAASTPAITGDSLESIISALQTVLLPRLLGREVLDFKQLLLENESAIEGNTSAKAAVDMALHDLFAKAYGLPLYRLLGAQRGRIKTCMTVSVKAIAEMVADVNHLCEFDVIKIKIGLNPKEDIARVAAIRKAVGEDKTLLVDANQGYDRKTAIAVIKALLPFHIALIEQPVTARDFESLKGVAVQSSQLIVADESCFSPSDALELAGLKACGGINVKLMESGGLENALAIYHIAKASGMKILVGCMLESPIGIAAMASFACAHPDILFADLDSLGLIRENTLLGGAKILGNEIVLSEKPGLGIEGFSGGLSIIGEC